ncbi:MAG: SMP-30/gluconolactonase/LRE family protein [Pseudomonadota bacterium]
MHPSQAPGPSVGGSVERIQALTPLIDGRPEPALLGEGAASFAEDPGAVWWVDILRKRLHRADDGAFAPGAAAPDVWSLPHELGAVRLIGAARDRFDLEGAGERSLWRLSVALGETAPRAMIELRRVADEPATNRFNDGAEGPDGLWYAGTMDRAESAAAGRLLRFRPDGAVEVIDAGPYRVSNGPAFSPDGSVMYHTDSARGLIYAFARKGSGWGDRSVFQRYGEGEGFPDGMCVRASGELMVAVWGGARLDRFAPSGARLEAITLPARYPTRPALAPDERAVFVTTATKPGGDVGAAGGALLRVAL